MVEPQIQPQASASPAVIRAAWREHTVRRAGATVFLVGVAAMIVISLFGPGWWSHKGDPAPVFLGETAIFLLAAVGAGVAIKDHPLGVVIDKRNKLSLSKLQMFLWTAVVIPALATLVAYRIFHGSGMDAAKIAIPGEVLAAMGISAASMVATPAVLSLKPEEGDQRVAIRPDDQRVSLVDLVRGDEEGNKDTIDLSKLQNFAITLLLIGIYAAVLYDRIPAIAWPVLVKGGKETLDTLNSLPPLSKEFVELMAISHAGYLLYKAAPKPSADKTPPVADPAKVHALG